tara:strand:- start:12040 stop:12822 length:783 start_codon:yes stop_codon:yes gene_type:complete
LVVADSRSARDGRIIEQVGRYDNVTENKEVVLNEDRILYWLQTGAQPSDTVRKILRNSGLLYKRHLMMWGKSEAEVEAAMTEWQAYRESKGDGDASRKDTHKSVLAAEETEYKKQVAEKASEAAKEVAAEAKAAEVTEEAVSEETTEDTAVVEENTATVEEVAAEPATEEAVVEEPVVEEVKEEVPAVEETEVVAEEVAVEKEEAKATTSEDGQDSSAMTAKEAADHIKNTDLAGLEGFIADDESRKTVLAAWESKQSEE